MLPLKAHLINGSVMSTVVAKLYWSLRLRGLVETVWAGFEAAVRRIMGRTDPRNPLRRSEMAFDRRFGVRTAGVVETDSLGLPGAAADHTKEYRASSDIPTAVALAALPISHRDYHFVDVGCGRGRVLLIADQLPFRAITGVELSTQLAQEAQRNVKAARRASTSTAINVCEADATRFALPDGPLVIYLFNPFDDVVLKAFITHVEESLAEALLSGPPRDCWLVYANALYRSVLDDRPLWSEYSYGDDWWAIYRFHAATSSSQA